MHAENLEKIHLVFIRQRLSDGLVGLMAIPASVLFL